MWIPDESQLLRCEFRMKVNFSDVNFGWKSTLSNCYIQRGKQNTNYIAFKNQTNLHNQNHLQ